MLLLYFLVKNEIDITQTTRAVEGELEKGVHAGIKEARGPHGSHKAALIQKLNQSQSGLDTKPILQYSQTLKYELIAAGDLKTNT